MPTLSQYIHSFLTTIWRENFINELSQQREVEWEKYSQYMLTHNCTRPTSLDNIKNNNIKWRMIEKKWKEIKIAMNFWFSFVSIFALSLSSRFL